VSDINNESAGSRDGSGLSNDRNQECVTFSYDSPWRFFSEPLDADLPMILIKGELVHLSDPTQCFQGATEETTKTLTWTSREPDAEIDLQYNRGRAFDPEHRVQESEKPY
jgi:hypothetical protein